MQRSSVGERLSEGPAPEVIQYLFVPRMKSDLEHNFVHISEINQAHVVMLHRQGIINWETAASLLRAIDEIEKGGPDQLSLDETREDLYFNYEYAVTAKTSTEIGGQMHTARSRNDLGATMMRMRTRTVLLEILDELLQLRSVLAETAESNIDVVMPGYTHLQPAQPITLAHYLCAIEQALQRDTDRLLRVLENANQSPLGAAALAGSGYPVDRSLTAQLLGFDGLVVNTLDAVAARDYLIEGLAAGSILGTTLSRFAQDLFVWYSWEFGMIDFRDRVASTSSIMPQKKNPVILETIKGRSAHVVGALTSALAGVRNTNYTNLVDGNREAFTTSWQGLESLRVCIVLSRIALENIIVNKELMYRRCSENFSTVTELADMLVTQWGITFRQAHEVVGYLTRGALARGLDASQIDASMVTKAATKVLDRVFEIDDTLVRRSLDPGNNVSVRDVPGGPAPDSTRAMIQIARQSRDDHQAQMLEITSRIERSRSELKQAISQVIKPSAS